jgi:TP901 family phage tail tape measure protein
MEQSGLRFEAENLNPFLQDITRAERAMDDLAAATERAARSFGAFDAVGKSAATAEKAVGSVGASANRASQAFTQMGNAAEKAARMDALTDKIGLQKRQLAILQQELDATAKKYGESSIQAQKKQLALDKLAQSIKQNEQALERLSKAEDTAARSLDDVGDKSEKGARGLDVLGNAITGATRRAGELVTDGLLEIGEAVVEIGAASIQAAGDYESGMLRFSAVSGTTGDELEDFSQLFLQLGADTQFSAAQAQEAAINLAKGGRTASQVAAELADTLTLAAAGELDLATAAEITAKQLGVWGDTGVTAAQVADRLAQASNASTVDVDELALGLAQAGGVAKVAGLSFDETVQIMALLAPGFASASDAGTSLKTMLTRLVPKTADATQAFKQLNLLTAEGTSKFYDATGAFVGMDQAAALLHDSMKDLSEAEKTAALQAMFGQDAFRAAALIAERGAEGFAAMGQQMDAAGTAAEQAAKRQQGFNFAMESLRGSMETLQIIAGTKLLPVLTQLIQSVLIPGVNALTLWVQGWGDTATTLTAVSDFIQGTVIPVLGGLSAATLLYALTQLPVLIASLGAASGAFIAQTAAMMGSLGPYALVAVMIGGVVKAYQDLNDKIETATKELLDSKPFWQASTEVLESHAAATGKAQDALEPLAGTVEVLRDQIEADIQALADHEAQYATFGAASGYTRDQLNAEMQAINAKAAALEVATTEYGRQEQAINAQTAAGITATGVTEGQRSGLEGLGTQISLTTGDIERLTKAIQDNATEGQEAVQAYATTESEFLTGVEQRRAEHQAKLAELTRTGNADQIKAAEDAYAEQERAAAAAYASQQAAQQQHLGQMLIDYTVAQAELGNISKERAAELTAALEQAYGLQESSVASTYLRMTQIIDASSADQSTSVSEVVSALQEQQQQAANTQQAMDAYAKQYVAEAVGNFIEKGQEADEYAAALLEIPEKAHTAVTTTAPKATDEVDEFHEHLDAIPREIRVQVEVDIPDVVLPHSPTPFEVGLWGIEHAMRAVGGESHRMGRSLQDLDLPEWLTPGSPTPLEEGLYGIADAEQAVDDRSREMGRALQLDLPEWLTPGSPTPLEEGLYGIADALRAVIEQGDTFGASLDDINAALKETSELIASALDASAAMSRQMADNLDVIHDLGGADIRDEREKTQADLAKRQAQLEAEFVSLAEKRAKMQSDMAKKQQELQAARSAEVQDTERIARLQAEIASLQSDISRSWDSDRAGQLREEIEALKQRDAALAKEAEIRDRLAKQAQAELDAALAVARTFKDPRAAKDYYDLISSQIQERRELEVRWATETDATERARLFQQLQLIEAAQAAERKAFEERQRHAESGFADLREQLQAIFDQMEIEGDMPPAIQALWEALVSLLSTSGLASGGVAQAGEWYWVGEQGPELVNFGRDSTVYDATTSRRMVSPVASPMQMAYGGGGASNVRGDIGVRLSLSRDLAAFVDARVDQRLAVEGRRADVRIRTGG